MNLKIIGTSHISQQSIEEIEQAVKELQPQIIAVELDAERASALLSKEKKGYSWRGLSQVGLKGFLFAKIGQLLQQKLGKMVGISPGSEMKAALELARKNKLELALIDQPLRLTLKNFSKSLSWKERFRFLGDILLGIFQGKKQLKKLGMEQFDLKKVPAAELIEKMMGQLKERYPNVYKTLVEDRNRYMVKQLVRIMRLHPEKKILIVVGAGHKKGMEELLQKM